MDSQYSTVQTHTTGRQGGVSIPIRDTQSIPILDNETVLELDYTLIEELQTWSETISRTIAPGCYRS